MVLLLELLVSDVFISDRVGIKDAVVTRDFIGIRDVIGISDLISIVDFIDIGDLIGTVNLTCNCDGIGIRDVMILLMKSRLKIM